MFTKNRPSDGFALPTILIASVVMLAVLLVSVQAVAASRVALNDQYYNQLAREAAESGANMAEECLKRFEREPIWDGSTLTPQTDCYGTVNAGISATLTNTSSISSTFVVSSPTDRTPTNSKFTSTGTVQLKRANGSIFKTYQHTAHASTGTAMQINGVAFGFGLILGSYFGSIDANGVVRTVGANNFGQLGNGTTGGISATPVTFNIGGRYAKRIYMESAGLGTSTFVVTTADEVWGSGTNAYGQLGNGVAQNRTEAGGNPVKFTLPAGVKPLRVQPAGYNTFVIGDNNRVYAAGSCELGAIGGPTTGCSNKTIDCGGNMTLLGQPNPQVVALPTPNPADPNTLPSSVMSSAGSFYYPLSRNCGEKMVGSGTSMYIIMQGGAVYGWGNNAERQMGQGRTAAGYQSVASAPVRIGSFGNTGQPKAVDVQTDGKTVNILDSNGEVWIAGNGTGGVVPKDFQIHGTNNINCLRNTSNTGITDGSVSFRSCITYTDDYSTWNIEGAPKVFTDMIKIVNKQTGLCLTAPPVGSPVTTTATGTACSANTQAQQWCAPSVDPTMYTLLNSSLYGCTGSEKRGLTDTYNVGATVTDRVMAAWFSEPTLRKVELPERIIKMSIASSNAAFITETGKVITRGVNSGGQRGDGSPAVNNLGRYDDTSYFQLPAAEKAVDVAITSIGTGGAERFYSNTYVVTESGKIYSSGTNTNGNLGIGSLGGSFPGGTPPFDPGYTSIPQRMLIFGDDIKAASVIAGNGAGVFYTTHQQVYGVGDNRWGNLGGGGPRVATPVKNEFVNIRPDFILY